MPSGARPKRVVVEVAVRNLRREVDVDPGARVEHVLARLGLPNSYCLSRTRNGTPFHPDADVHRQVTKGAVIHAFPAPDVAVQPEFSLFDQLETEEHQ